MDDSQYVAALHFDYYIEKEFQKVIVESPFKPAWWMPTAHMQTILPRLYRKRHSVKTIDEVFELPDGDFVELCWSAKPDPQDNLPLVVLFHGLGGSIDSFYATG